MIPILGGTQNYNDIRRGTALVWRAGWVSFLLFLKHLKKVLCGLWLDSVPKTIGLDRGPELRASDSVPPTTVGHVCSEWNNTGQGPLGLGSWATPWLPGSPSVHSKFYFVAHLKALEESPAISSPFTLSLFFLDLRNCLLHEGILCDKHSKSLLMVILHFANGSDPIQLNIIKWNNLCYLQ